MQKLTDERRGVASASNMYALSQCPGKDALVSELRRRGKLFEAPNPDRDAGLRIHAYLAARVLEFETPSEQLAERFKLSASDIKTAQACEELRDALLLNWNDGFAIPADQGLRLIERRFWYPNRWLACFSAKLDYVLIDEQENRALVTDFKSGRKEAQAAADNLQLRTQAVCLHAAYPYLTEISAAIVEPWVTWSPERVTYDLADLGKATQQILTIVKDSIRLSDKRVAGAWCDVCAARAHCQEARDYVAAVHKLGIERGIVDLPLGARGSKVLEDIKSVRSILEQMEAGYKAILEKDPDALPDHFLHDGKLKRSLLDIAAAKERLYNEAGFTEAEVDACATYWVAKIEEAFAAKKGLKLGLRSRSAEDAFANLMTGLIEENRGEAYITRRSQKERRQRQLAAEAKPI